MQQEFEFEFYYALYLGTIYFINKCLNKFMSQLNVFKWVILKY